jgi:hypothetical protein
LILVLLLSLFSACSGADSVRPRELTERDSAGVLILTHAAGLFTDTVSSAPLLAIGQEGDPDYEFFRIGTAASLASGNLVVANGGTHELRFYDPSGKHIRTVGRRGEGPAEFGFLSTLWIGPGDTVMVLDPNRRRIVYFDSAGVLARGESYAQDLTNESPDSQNPCVFPGLMGLFEDGARVVSGWGCMQFQGTNGRRPTVVPIDLVRSGERVNVGSFAATWVWERANPENPRDFFSLIPFSRRMTYVVGPDRLFVSEGADLEIQIFDPHGRLIGLLREDAVPPRVSAADREAYVEEQAATPRPHPEDVPFPDRFGSYSQLLLSHEGELWVRRVPRPMDSLQHWVVFSKDGRKIRRVVVPDVRVATVRGERIVGFVSDTLGIETVVLLYARR